MDEEGVDDMREYSGVGDGFQADDGLHVLVCRRPQYNSETSCLIM